MPITRTEQNRRQGGAGTAEAHPEGTAARWPGHQATDQRGPELLVLDAAAALDWIFDDEKEDLPPLLMDAIGRGHVVVPAHWILEVTNGLLLAQRRGRLRPDEQPDEISCWGG